MTARGDRISDERAVNGDWPTLGGGACKGSPTVGAQEHRAAISGGCLTGVAEITNVLHRTGGGGRTRRVTDGGAK